MVVLQVSQNLTTIWESFASLGYPQLNTEVRYTEGLSLVQSSQQLQSQVGHKEGTKPKVPTRASYWLMVPTVTVTVLLRTGP